MYISCFYAVQFFSPFCIVNTTQVSCLYLSASLIFPVIVLRPLSCLVQCKGVGFQYLPQLEVHSTKNYSELELSVFSFFSPFFFVCLYFKMISRLTYHNCFTDLYVPL